MERSSRKAAVWVGVVALLLLVPLVLLSSGMMDLYQRQIDANPKTTFHRWLQLKTADVCLATWRPAMAAARYRKFIEHYPEAEQRRYAMLRFAASLEDADKTADAIAVYQRFVQDYPDGEDTRQARGGVDRLRHMR
jgi:hypothetical protein